MTLPLGRRSHYGSSSYGRSISSHISGDGDHSGGGSSSSIEGSRNRGGRWLTAEFLFYYCYASFFFYSFFARSRSLSLSLGAPSSPWRPWLPGLREGGWLPLPTSLQQIDLSDPQWRNFRQNLLLLCMVMSALCIPGRLLWQRLKLRRSAVSSGGNGSNHYNSSTLQRNDVSGCRSDVRVSSSNSVSSRRVSRAQRQLVLFWAAAGTAYVVYLHGFASVFVFSFAALNFVFTVTLAGRNLTLNLPSKVQGSGIGNTNANGNVSGGFNLDLFVPLLWLGHAAFFAAARSADGFRFAAAMPFVAEASQVLLGLVQVAYTELTWIGVGWSVWAGGLWRLLLLPLTAWLGVSGFDSPGTGSSDAGSSGGGGRWWGRGWWWGAVDVTAAEAGMAVDVVVGTLRWMDMHCGVFRWHVCLNLLMLRTISYSCDAHWHLRQLQLQQKQHQECQQQQQKQQQHQHNASTTSNDPQPQVAVASAEGPEVTAASLYCDALLYVAYLFFPPVYLTGPTITFDDFAAQLLCLPHSSAAAPAAATPAAAAPSRLAESMGKESRRSLERQVDDDGERRVDGNDSGRLEDNGEDRHVDGDDSGTADGPLPVTVKSCTNAVRLSTSSTRSRSIDVSPRTILLYALRTVFDLVLLELVLHWAYFPALAASRLWRQMTPADLACVSYGVLLFVWLKFLCIWRVARLWSLIAGVDPPENMRRCVSNNYDVQGFWRGWHVSFYTWLQRYVYIPLGGRRRRAVNAFVVFTFVAVWHDLIEWRLLCWAWLMCLLLLPEAAVKAVVAMPRFEEFRRSAWYRECCAMAGAINILGLITANLVGFVVGPADARELVTMTLLQPSARPLLLFLLLSLYIGVKLMLEIREEEGRRRSRVKHS